MIPSSPLVFLDANVLYSRTLRDWICLLALESAYDLRYSEDVLAEWMYRLRRKRPELSEHAIGGQRRKFVAAFPNGMVTGYSPGSVPCPPDPDDRHVLAAALHGGVDVLVTNDRHHVADASMDLVWRVLARQLDYYRRTRGTGDYDEAELVAFLRKAGAARFAERLERLAT
ncbi:putative toxin-antitoxin system toxin component, PIN family [Micromonospora haikouensis]|uniref:PIN domain-containing protein n=1 Tax=Micromonospora haikouensis TaxID=686309 RepID=UPI003447670E